MRPLFKMAEIKEVSFHMIMKSFRLLSNAKSRLANNANNAKVLPLPSHEVLKFYTLFIER